MATPAPVEAATANANVKPQADASSAAAEDKNQPKLTGKALVDTLRAQLDYYFTDANLRNDTHLRSQMNAAKYVSVDVIATFKRIKSQTEDRAVLLEALRGCKNLALDEASANVRPTTAAIASLPTGTAALAAAAPKVERTTLILRDIAASAPAAELRALFEADGAPSKGKVTGLRADIGDTWFVTFDTAEACAKTALYLTNQSFQGKPIRCRVKSETRSYAPPAPHAMVQGTGSITTPIPGVGYGFVAGPYNNGYYYMPQQNPYYGAQYNPKQMQQMQQNAPQQNAAQNSRQAKGKKARGQQQPNQPQQQAPAPQQPQQQQQPQQPQANTRAGGQPQAAAAPKQTKAQKKAQAAATQAAEAAAAAGAGARKSASGHSYTKAEMNDIIKAFQKSGENTRPSTLPAGSVIARASPLTDCQLMAPVPLIIPQSPSPAMTAQVARAGPPLLDLANGAAVAGPTARTGRTPRSSPAVTPMPAPHGSPIAAPLNAPGQGPANATAKRAAPKQSKPTAAAAANLAAALNTAAGAKADAQAKGTKPPLRPAAQAAAPAPAPAPAKPAGNSFAARLGSKVGAKPTQLMQSPPQAAATAAPAGAAAPAAAAAAAPAPAPAASGSPAGTPTPGSPGAAAKAAGGSAPSSPAKKPRGHSQLPPATTAPAPAAAGAAPAPASPQKAAKMSWADMAKRKAAAAAAAGGAAATVTTAVAAAPAS